MIETIQILNTQGQRCNVLHQGDSFCVAIDYHADEDINNLELACSLHDKSGQMITGQRFPELGQSLPPISAGTSFRCRFRFEGRLQAGLYFLNAGAWNCPERIYLHRIVDGCAMPVLPARQTSYGFGIVNLAEGAPELS